MKNEKHKVNSLVKRVCLVLSLLTPGSSMMVIASDEIAIVQQTGNITVTGTVVDQTGEPVIGVNVLVKGSTNGTITDIDGKVSLKGVSPNSILTVSYIGYKTETVNLNGKKVLQIILKEDSEMLNEVVVVGYGTQKKVNMSGAVDAVSSKVLENRSLSNAGLGLQGAVPNLNITVTDGNANSSPKYNIRGIGSINSDSAEPLILVDNIPVTADEFSRMNANDIENVSVLKDASSAAIYGARAAVIGGCAGTSNVLTGQMFNVPVLGTHAHSWIMSFPDEYTAFKTYAKMYPNSCTLLVDTYDVLKSGVPNAIRVFEEMREEGIQLTHYGIRIDSGDLAYLSKEAYKMLAAAGFDDATISASSDLDEYLIDSLKTQDAKINSWGVGTNLITSKDNPAFGGVYKLAAVKDDGSSSFTPKIKLSENTEKVTNPGNKTVYRIYSKSTGKIKADLICLADEVFDPEETMIIFDPTDTWKKTKVLGGTYELRELLIPVIREGKRVYTSPEVMDLRAYCQKEQNTLWDESRRLVNPQKVYVDLSQKLFDLKKNLLEEMSEKALD